MTIQTFIAYSGEKRGLVKLMPGSNKENKLVIYLCEENPADPTLGSNTPLIEETFKRALELGYNSNEVIVIDPNAEKEDCCKAHALCYTEEHQTGSPRLVWHFKTKELLVEEDKLPINWFDQPSPSEWAMSSNTLN